MKWKLEVISPVHIGTGEQLSQFDYAYDSPNQTLIIIDFDKTLEDPKVDPDELSKAMRNRNFRMDEFLSKRKVDLGDVEKYRIPCKTDPATSGLRVQMKDIYGNPYIPGSSIKGAIRTAFFWTILAEDDDIFDYADRYLNSVVTSRDKKDRRRVDDPIEKKVFGKNPNFDLFRSIHVSGSKSIGLDDCLEAGEIWTYTLNRNDKLVPKRERNTEYKISVEQLKPAATTDLTIKIDEYLFKQICAELGFKKTQEEDVHYFPFICNKFAESLIDSERDFYDDYGLDDIAGFYDQLEDEIDPDSNDEFLLCIGWGGGYEAKTVTDLFRKDENFDFEALRRKFRLGKSRSGNYPDNPVFPKTRRLATEYGVANYPMGWVKLSRI